MKASIIVYNTQYLVQLFKNLLWLLTVSLFRTLSCCYL